MELDKFKDRPSDIDDYYNNLSLFEKSVYKKGYLSSLHKLLEQISESKIRIGNKLIVCEDRHEKTQLNAKLHVLDIYEAYYEKVANQTHQELELQP